MCDSEVGDRASAHGAAILPAKTHESGLRKSASATRGYGWHRLAGDAAGGAIAALVALPYGLAMARLVGLPPELGLFTSILTAPVTSPFW
jgi:SulP family sulfate permease